MVGPGCGDGALALAAGEECDDGGVAAGDGCSPTCQLEPLGATCGDGQDDPLEVCEDGNVANGDACNPTCNLGDTTTLFVGSPGKPGSTDGTGPAARIGGPGALAVDQSNLYVADAANHTIRKVVISSAQMSTLAGLPGLPGFADGVGAAVRFMCIEAITTDGRRCGSPTAATAACAS